MRAFFHYLSSQNYKAKSGAINIELSWRWILKKNNQDRAIRRRLFTLVDET